MGLSEAGLTVPTGAEYLDQIVSEYERLTGLTVDRTRTDDQLVMILATIFSDALGGASELVQANYDGTNSEAAIGKQLEDAAFLVGVDPDPATRSQATVTLGAVAGTVIPAGSLVEGGGDADDARWTTSSAVTSTGSDAVVVTAQQPGPITAAIGKIDKIVNAIPGWNTVTNAAAAAPGENRESDASIRSKRRRALQQTGSASTSAIRSALLDFDFVTGVVVLENNSAVGQTISGKALNANSVWVFVVPASLTSAQEDSIGESIHLKLAAGTEMMGSGGGSEVNRTVTDVGGVTSHVVKWDEGTSVSTDITWTVTLEAGFELADVTSALEDATTAFFADLNMGDILREYDLVIATAGIEGIDAITVVASIGALPHNPGIDGTMTLGTTTVT